ncbi:hypothetical protein D1J63_08080 [Streptomyces sp. KPB2]|nr:hypothetical protein D1J63_08080 [Streptomyces sp. KPB2]
MFRSGGTCPGGASYVTRSALPRGGPFYVFPVRVLPVRALACPRTCPRVFPLRTVGHVAVRLGDTFTRVVQYPGRAVSRPGDVRSGELV